jgi:hypothetical protein
MFYVPSFTLENRNPEAKERKREISSEKTGVGVLGEHLSAEGQDVLTTKPYQRSSNVGFLSSFKT